MAIWGPALGGRVAAVMRSWLTKKSPIWLDSRLLARSWPVVPADTAAFSNPTHIWPSDARRSALCWHWCLLESRSRDCHAIVVSRPCQVGLAWLERIFDLPSAGAAPTTPLQAVSVGSMAHASEPAGRVRPALRPHRLVLERSGEICFYAFSSADVVGVRLCWRSVMGNAGPNDASYEWAFPATRPISDTDMAGCPSNRRQSILAWSIWF
jgi:hypothetical protein